MKKLVALVTLLWAFAVHAGFEEAVQSLQAGDYDTALKEYQTLADQGDARGHFGVGYMYHYGHGVPRDQVEAVKHFRTAANNGNIPARQYLGILFQKGDGIEKDLVAAHMWYTLYSKVAPNDRDRAYTRDTVSKMERRMTPEQIAQAKKLAAEWKPEK